MNYPVFLADSLAKHRRGRILVDAVAAAPVDSHPSGCGVCLMFGVDFQDGNPKTQNGWLDWCAPAGRTLLLVPPFSQGVCPAPVEWEALDRTGVKAQDGRALLRTLAPEVRYELSGKLQVPAHIGGTWENYIVNTAYYRKHPHSGIFAVTTLPLWSLTVLDRKKQLREWLDELHMLAGVPSQAEVTEQVTFKATNKHYTILLHLLSCDFGDKASALAALASSHILRIDPAEADRCLDELQAEGLVEKVKVTDKGRALIELSQYNIYSEALRQAVSRT